MENIPVLEIFSTYPEIVELHFDARKTGRRLSQNAYLHVQLQAHPLPTTVSLKTGHEDGNVAGDRQSVDVRFLFHTAPSM